MDDDFAAKIANKYDKGIFNMASIGFEALEWSEDPSLMLPGQTFPTVTKWRLKEVSITDIGANPNCCKLSHNGKLLLLNEKTKAEDIQDFFNSNSNPQLNMKKTIAALNASGLVTLSEVATDELVSEGVKAVAGALTAKDTQLQLKDVEIAQLKAEINSAKTVALKDKATMLVDNALSAKKIVAAQKEPYVTLASASEAGYESIKKIFEGMTGYVPVSGQLSTESFMTVNDKSELLKKFDVVLKDGSLDALTKSTKPEDKELLNQMWNAKFGKNYGDK